MFTTWTDGEGKVYLEQLGKTTIASPESLTHGIGNILAPYLAGRAWDVQAANLRKFLERTSDLPKLFPSAR